MNTHEQRVREFAYQIWESEGRPFGHSDRHWAMAMKLAASHDEHAQDEHAQGDTDIPGGEPIQPITPEPAQPIPPSDPIQPGEPPQQPAQPVAVTPPRKSRAKAAASAPAKSLIDTNPIALGKPGDPTMKKTATAQKSSKPKKSKVTDNESA